MRIERVIDGDTVVLTRFGTTRLIGVITPAEGRCGDDAATRFTRRRLEEQRVEYELGVERRDRNGRTLAIGAAERRRRAAERRAERRRGAYSIRIQEDCSEVDAPVPTPR